MRYGVDKKGHQRRKVGPINLQRINFNKILFNVFEFSSFFPTDFNILRLFIISTNILYFRFN